MAAIGSRLERAHDAVLAVLPGGAPGTIDVYLSELLAQYQGYRLSAGGYALPNRLQIHDVYRPDSPGEGLERSLLTIFLVRATGAEEVPELLLDGLLVTVTQALGSDLTPEKVNERLAAAKTNGALPPLAWMVNGPTAETREIYYAAAAGFVAFVLSTRGPAGIIQLAGALNAAGGPAAPAELERAWRKSIKARTPGGVLRFFRLSGAFLREYRLKVAEITVYIVLGVAFTIFMQLVPGWLVDVLNGQPAHILNSTVTSPWPLIATLAIAFVIISIMSQRQSYLTAFVSAGILKEMRLRAFTVLQDLQPGYFQSTTSGDVISRMTNDMSEVQGALTGPMTQILQGGLTILLALIVALHTNWQITLATLIFMPLFFVIGHYLGPRAAQRSMDLQQQLGRATGTLQENLGAQPVVKAFGLQRHVIDAYTRDLNAVFRSTLRLTFLMGIYGWAVTSTATGINLFILAVGAWMVVHGQMSAGILIQFLGLMNQIIGPVHGFAGMIQGLQQASGSMDRVDELLKTKPTIADAPDAQHIPPLRAAITFEDVSFGYAEGEPTLRNVNLTVAAGTRVALIGRSGSGKSTALSLILRFHDPTDGRVTFDGVDIRQAALASLRGQLGVVFQDNVLFNTSLRENIRLGNLDATDADIVRAAQMAEIHDFIMGLPDEYDTLVGERGARLSGGQRQRIAIARAIVRNPAVLLLDEATSALDPVTEAAINETLERVGQGRTTVTVTHRLASIRDVDQIYVLDAGVVVEHGTHGELIEKGGSYARLWEEQGGGMVELTLPREAVEIGFLRRVPLFSGFPPELLSLLVSQLVREEVATGQDVVSRGEIAGRLYIIQEGRVEVLDPDPATGNRPLAILREGDHFGEIALLNDTSRMATVRALTPATLYSLSREDFGTLLVSVPGFREAVEATAAGRARVGERRGAATIVQPSGVRQSP